MPEIDVHEIDVRLMCAPPPFGETSEPEEPVELPEEEDPLAPEAMPEEQIDSPDREEELLPVP